MDDGARVAMVHRIQDLLNALTCIGLRVELTRYNVLEQFATRYQVENEIQQDCRGAQLVYKNKNLKNT